MEKDMMTATTKTYKHVVEKTVKTEVEYNVSEGCFARAKELCIQRADIDKELNKFLSEWVKRVDPLSFDDDKFLNIHSIYRTMIFECRPNRERVNHAAEELLRRASFEFPHQFEYNFQDIIAFHNALDEAKATISKALWDAPTDKSDDGYGDFIDALSIVYPELIGRIIAGQFESTIGEMQELKDAIRGHFQPDYTMDADKFVDWVWDGENYVNFSLYQAMEKYLPTFLKHIDD